jgi:hypothetical protein
VIARLSDYLGRELGPFNVLRIILHLAGRAPCHAYPRTLRATIRVAGRAADVEMPREMKERLRMFLASRD